MLTDNTQDIMKPLFKIKGETTDFNYQHKECSEIYIKFNLINNMYNKKII